MKRNSPTNVLLAALLSLASCGKGDEAKSSTSTATAKPAGALGTVKAQTTPASAVPSVLPSARAIASQLMTTGLSLADSFTIGAPIACELPASGDAWDVRCRAMFFDSERKGNPAALEIQIFDRDMEFTGVDQRLKSNLEAVDGIGTLGTHPDITLTPRGSQTAIKMPAACHQSLGPQNSSGYCAAMVTPRVYLVAAVFPKNQSTENLSVSFNGNSGDGNMADIDHAQDLLFLGVMNVIDTARKTAGTAALQSLSIASTTAIDPATGASYGCEANFGVPACGALALVSGPAGRKIAPENLWGATAISSKTLDYGYSYGHSNSSQAISDAVRSCAGVSGAPDCKVISSFSGYCSAIAMSPTTRNWGISGVSAATDIAAKDSLLRCHAKDCAVKVSFCTDNRPHVSSNAPR